MEYIFLFLQFFEVFIFLTSTCYSIDIYFIFKAGASSLEITQFIRENYLPLVGERSQRNRWKYENKYPLVVVYYDVDFSFDHRIRK